MDEWWISLDSGVQSAALQSATSVFVFVLGAVLLAWQIGRQANKSRELADKTASDAIKLDIYKQVIDATNRASTAILETTSYTRSFVMAVEAGNDLLADGLNPASPKQQWRTFSARHFAATSSVIDLTLLIENWQVIEPRLKIFGLAYGERLDALSKNFYMLSPILMRTMPMQDERGEPLQWLWPPRDRVAEIRAIFDRYEDVMGTLSAYVSDLRVEMQNVLIAPLFGNYAERRDAPDPAQQAIRVDRSESIEATLMATEWGQRSIQTEAEAWARFAIEKEN